MYQNINRLNKSLPYINGKINHDPDKKQIHKAPIKRLLEQNTLITENKPGTYLTNLNVYPDAVKQVRDHLEEYIKEIGQEAAKHALKTGRATIMHPDIEYAIKEINKHTKVRGNKYNRTDAWNKSHNHDQNGKYIANIQTKIYHLPDCKKLDKTKEDNKIQTNNTLNLYKPCQYCQGGKKGSKNNPTPEWLKKQDHKTHGIFIGNINTHIYHHPDCHDVKKMNNKYKITTDNIQALYQPCAHCRPDKNIQKTLLHVYHLEKRALKCEDTKILQIFKTGCHIHGFQSPEEVKMYPDNTYGMKITGKPGKWHVYYQCTTCKKKIPYHMAQLHYKIKNNQKQIIGPMESVTV